MREIQTIQIGGLAKNALVQNISGKVAGITSKGIFLESSRRILFLTSADYRSPYNLQVPEMEQVAELIKMGETWQSANEGINFESSELRIDFKNAKVWSPEKLILIETEMEYQRQRMRYFVDQLYNLDPSKGWAFLVPGQPQNSLEAAIIRMTNDFTAAFRNADLDACLAASRPILGLGGGLTPSGDDWLAGFLLLHTRRNQALGESFGFQAAFEKSLVAMAFERTTSISANRIEAACMGWAEDLFMRVVDDLYTQNEILTESDLHTIVNFGHSSGVDTCMGIWVGLGVK